MSQETKILVGVGVVTLLIFVGGIFFFSKSSKSSPQEGNVDANSPLLVKSDSHQIASSSANLKVTVVEFGDYQCPACEAAYPITKQMLADYQGKINFVFRNFPLPMHPNAPEAAEAAEAAAVQGKFWEMHDKLYDTQNEWADLSNPTDKFVSYAGDIGLNVDQFKADITSNKYADIIKADQSDGNSLGISATPTFFINGQRIVGVPTYNTLKKAIDSDLSQ